MSASNALTRLVGWSSLTRSGKRNPDKNNPAGQRGTAVPRDLIGGDKDLGDPPFLSNALATEAANQAAIRQRKKGKTVDALTKLAPSDQTPVKPSLRKRTLLGGSGDY